MLDDDDSYGSRGYSSSSDSDDSPKEARGSSSKTAIDPVKYYSEKIREMKALYVTKARILTRIHRPAAAFSTGETDDDDLMATFNSGGGGDESTSRILEDVIGTRFRGSGGDGEQNEIPTRRRDDAFGKTKNVRKNIKYQSSNDDDGGGLELFIDSIEPSRKSITLYKDLFTENLLGLEETLISISLGESRGDSGRTAPATPMPTGRILKGGVTKLLKKKTRTLDEDDDDFFSKNPADRDSILDSLEGISGPAAVKSRPLVSITGEFAEDFEDQQFSLKVRRWAAVLPKNPFVNSLNPRMFAAVVVWLDLAVPIFWGDFFKNLQFSKSDGNVYSNIQGDKEDIGAEIDRVFSPKNPGFSERRSANLRDAASRLVNATKSGENPTFTSMDKFQFITYLTTLMSNLVF